MSGKLYEILWFNHQLSEDDRDSNDQNSGDDDIVVQEIGSDEDDIENRSDVAGSDVRSDDGSVGREGRHACGSLIGFEKEIADDDSNSSYDVGPY